MFEVESDGFIIQLKKEELDLKCSTYWNGLQSTGLSKSRSIPVRYMSADEFGLEHASAVAQNVLFTLADGDLGEEDLTLHGRSALADEMKQKSSATGEIDREFRLKLSEAVDVYHENFDILEKAVRYLCRTEKSSDVLSRAARMVESFFSLVGKPKPAFDMGAPGLRMEDEGTMVKVVSLVEKMASKTFPDLAMCKSFVRIYTSFEKCDKKGNVQQATTLLLKNILSASHQLSENAVLALRRDLGSILGRIGGEHSPIAVLLYTLFSENGASAWGFNGGDALYGIGCPASPTLAVALFSIGACEESDAECLANLADMYYNGYQKNIQNSVKAKEFYACAIDEGAGVRAMNNVANLHKDGTHGVDADPVRAVELYDRAIDEGADVLAMCNLANLLKDGAHGVDADPVRAVELYNRAIDEGSDVDAMRNLAVLRFIGAPGVDADPAQAVNLFNRAIDEGADVNAMVACANVLKGGAAGVDANPARAVDLYDRAIDEESNVFAKWFLAVLLEEGAPGVDADPAFDLYNRAMDIGSEVGEMTNLLLVLEEGAPGVDADPARAVGLYNRAIEKEPDADVMNSLANLLKNGADGVDVDPTRAVALYSRAIDEEGSVDAMSSLANVLKSGTDGVDADPARAVVLYNRAIDGGSVFAKYDIAVLPIEGKDSVQGENKQAVDIYCRAIEEVCQADTMTDVARYLKFVDFARAVKLYNRAVDEGNVVAMYDLADILVKGGAGVNADPARAAQLYRRAIQKGDIFAMCDLASLLVEGAEGVDADPAQAVDLYSREIEEEGVLRCIEEHASLLARGGEGVDADPIRAIELFSKLYFSDYERAVAEGLTGVTQTIVSIQTNYRYCGSCCVRLAQIEGSVFEHSYSIFCRYSKR